MSVRLCYLERTQRGGMLRAARMIGHGVDLHWPDVPAPSVDSVEAALPWIERGSEFVQEHLANTRSAGRLEALVLDVDGAMCSWIAGMGTDHQALAAAARMGSGGDHLADAPGMESASVTPVTYFAGDAVDSTIQPLGQPVDEASATTDPVEGGGVAILSRLKKSGAKSAPAAAGRRGILAACDLPGRLFIDALDRRGVEVGRAITLWHALAQAWDPSSRVSASSASTSSPLTSAGTCAVVLVDPGEAAAGENQGATPPRLIWAWSRGGSLLAGGSIRLGHARGEAATEVALGKDEASRLAAEWLAWSMQLGISPRRVVCVLPESTRENDSARVFGTALGAAWNGASVDAGITKDPIGDTLERLALALESTSEKSIETTPGAALIELSSRPGGAHRSMYKWLAIAVLAAAVVMGVVAWQARRSAERILASAMVWNEKGLSAAKAAVGGVAPDLQTLRDEVRLRERELIPPSRVVPAKPILEELETISMVISHEDLTLETIDLSSANLVRVTITAEKIATLEAVTNALRQISGSKVNRWEADYKDFNSPKGGTAVRATLSATWQDTGAKTE